MQHSPNKYTILEKKKNVAIKPLEIKMKKKKNYAWNKLLSYQSSINVSYLLNCIFGPGPE